MPRCYSTCDVYSPRRDLKCQRFTEGIVGIEHAGAPVANLMKIQFEKWGKLEGEGTLRLQTAAAAKSEERADESLARLLRKLPIPYYFKVRLARARAWRKDRLVRNAAARANGVDPSAFVVEAYNPSTVPASFTLTIRPKATGPIPPFQKRCVFSSGFSRTVVPFQEIRRQRDLSGEFLVQLEPAAAHTNEVIYFGMIDFTVLDGAAPRTAGPTSTSEGRQASATRAPVTKREAKAPPVPAAKIKCVVWDLDNTLWDGVLIRRRN